MVAIVDLATRIVAGAGVDVDAVVEPLAGTVAVTAVGTDINTHAKLVNRWKRRNELPPFRIMQNTLAFVRNCWYFKFGGSLPNDSF